VQADATATTLFTVGPHPLVLAHANATTGFTAAPLPLVLAQSPVGSGIGGSRGGGSGRSLSGGGHINPILLLSLWLTHELSHGHTIAVRQHKRANAIDIYHMDCILLFPEVGAFTNFA